MTTPFHDHVLAGPRTLREAAETHAQLSAWLCQGDVVLDCTGVTEADLTFVQMILAAGRSAAAAGHRFAVRLPPQGPLGETLRRGGFRCGAAGQAASDPADWCAA